MLCYRHPIIQRLYASPILDFTLPAIPTPAKLAQPVFHPILSKNLKVFFPRKCLNCELKARSVSRVNASLGLKFIHFWQKRALQCSRLRHISTSITTTTTTTTAAKSSASSYSLKRTPSTALNDSSPVPAMATPPCAKTASGDDAEKSQNNRACKKQKKNPPNFS
jgi:hypothetical protein